MVRAPRETIRVQPLRALAASPHPGRDLVWVPEALAASGLPSLQGAPCRAWPILSPGSLPRENCGWFSHPALLRGSGRQEGTGS